MLKNEEIKRIYELLKMYEIPVEDEKIREKLRILVSQIELMEESQSKMAKLQDEIVNLEKSDKDEKEVI